MGRVLAKRALCCHGDASAHGLRACSVEVTADPAGMICLEYVAVGTIEQLAIPSITDPARCDGLWRSTCFELFVGGVGEGYAEFNFAPSGQWAAYGFTGYREGMHDLPMAHPPIISCQRNAGRLAVKIRLLAMDIAGRRIGLSAVIEELDGTRSYWALAHPAGAPDFHHADCFALELPAPSAS